MSSWLRKLSLSLVSHAGTVTFNATANVACVRLLGTLPYHQHHQHHNTIDCPSIKTLETPSSSALQLN
jgi:hypothetical protein